MYGESSTYVFIECVIQNAPQLMSGSRFTTYTSLSFGTIKALQVVVLNEDKVVVTQRKLM